MFVAQRLWAVAVLMWCGVVILFTRNPAAVAQRSQHQQRQVLLAGQQLRSRVEALDLTIRADPGSGKKIRVMQLAAERLIEVLAAPTDIESGDTGAHGVKRLALQVCDECAGGVSLFHHVGRCGLATCASLSLS